MGKCEPSDVLMKVVQDLWATFWYRYSRRIVWLELSTTNNDPNVILLSYLLAVLNNSGKYMHG